MLVTIRTKKGFTDKQVWDFLLSKDIGITFTGVDTYSAPVRKKWLPELKKMADVTEAKNDTVRQDQPTRPG